jgi:hypothetical protein
MNGLSARARRWLVWLLPFLALSVVIAWEADWGRKWRHVPVTDAVVVPQPVVVAVLPEYKPAETLASQRDIVDRSLFNPTRRPAPAAASDAKRRLQPGQFVLTGTLIIDGKATAFLRENTGGKSRRVAQGDQVNGMLVTDVKPDRIKLTLGDESEDLVLKVAAGPKTTTQPVTAPPAAPATAGAGGGAAAPAGQTTADVLAERRRAQQAAEAAAARAAGRPPVLNAPPAGAYLPPGGAAPAPAPLDPRWGQQGVRVRPPVQGQPMPATQ